MTGKITSVEDAHYDPATNTLTAQCRDKDGIVVIEMDGLAFASLMGLANIKNAVLGHVQQGKPLPLLPVTGIQTGTDANGLMLLALLVQQIGLLTFQLPAPIETALREKLQKPTIQ